MGLSMALSGLPHSMLAGFWATKVAVEDCLKPSLSVTSIISANIVEENCHRPAKIQGEEKQTPPLDERVARLYCKATHKMGNVAAIFKNKIRQYTIPLNNFWMNEWMRKRMNEVLSSFIPVTPPIPPPFYLGFHAVTVLLLDNCSFTKSYENCKLIGSGLRLVYTIFLSYSLGIKKQPVF